MLCLAGKFKAFFIVEFSSAEAVRQVLDQSEHSDLRGAGSPVPVYSPFLWLQGKPGPPEQKNTTAATSREPSPEPVESPIFLLIILSKDDPASVLARVREEPDPSQQMFLLWKASMMSETSNRVRYLLGRQLELAISGLFAI